MCGVCGLILSPYEDMPLLALVVVRTKTRVLLSVIFYCDDA